VPCAIISSEALQSQLTALVTRSAEPRRATLLLIDVDSLSAEMQAEIAPFIVHRAAGLRLVYTSRQPLAELARLGRFRQDLAAALSTLAIELPPLSQRRADMPLLVQLLVEDINARSQKQLAGLTPEALNALDLYAWPGNIDELNHVLVEAHKRAEGREIGLHDLPDRIHYATQAAAHPRRREETIMLDQFLAQIERELIHRALARSKGNKAKAARLLGLTRPRLYRRMVQLGLVKEE
jgi:DNA-binding NtrC family response regulator